MRFPSWFLVPAPTRLRPTPAPPSASSQLPPVPAYVRTCRPHPSCRFIIDAFRYAGEFTAAYFLSRFHSDHYAGLGPSWSRGLVFYSALTARLLVSVLSVPRQLLVVSAGYWIPRFSKGEKTLQLLMQTASDSCVMSQHEIQKTVEGLDDSLDLVPTGAWYENGWKTGRYNPFLMACYNPKYEEFQTVCHVMSDFSDEFYEEMELYSVDRILPKNETCLHTTKQVS
ncbi:hypothetical protein GUJ93_ZPchr0001g29720 [Zizania palustris]|uniref:ATP-dependent DNA ligase family profile domain-containing protein n=1 Tax=Zizania palustris TaxID=103762 RepID=A0A8J5SH41_ZIZPA|nr:hypothetical protein GUJ93_ZPchr0001g29720 [Zizania palustris]